MSAPGKGFNDVRGMARATNEISNPDVLVRRVDAATRIANASGHDRLAQIVGKKEVRTTPASHRLYNGLLAICLGGCPIGQQNERMIRVGSGWACRAMTRDLDVAESMLI